MDAETLSKKKRHIELHESLDELLACFIGAHPNELFLDKPISDLVEWSFEQTKDD